MLAGGQFFLEYSKEVLFARDVPPYNTIKSYITIEDNALAAITNIDERFITGTVYKR
jgi:hypothetical protein